MQTLVEDLSSVRGERGSSSGECLVGGTQRDVKDVGDSPVPSRRVSLTTRREGVVRGSFRP